MLPTRTEAIRNFLNAKSYPDLAALYSPNMEVQVNVARDEGTEVQKEFEGRNWRVWTNGVQEWKSFRIPYGANSNPEYNLNTRMEYDIVRHAEAIGMTGWDWANRVSKWVGFDFDSIIGHSNLHTKKLTDTELVELEEKIHHIDWVTLRLSTGGNGRHIYIFLNNIPTDNHTEHAALARSILGMLSGVTGFDFSAKVDACGGILWQWARKMVGTQGLKLIKQGTILQSVPSNWRDHINVISGKSKRTLPKFVNEENEDGFNEVAGQNSLIILDKGHRQLMKFIEEKCLNSYWDQDRHMLVTHTYYLLMAHRELGLRGPFSTLAAGNDTPNDVNCFAFPIRNGAWSVRRYSPGVQETDTWTQDPKGYTKCYFNREPDFDTACLAMGGNLTAKGGYIFHEASVALEAARLLNVNLEIAPYAATRRATLSKNKDDRLIIEIEAEVGKDQPMKGWHIEKKNWQKVVPMVHESGPEEVEIQNFDHTIRNLVKTGKFYGWGIKTVEDVWNIHPYQHIKPALTALGQGNRESTIIAGAAVIKPWSIVNLPFQPEYLEGRMWNKDAAQLAYAPNMSSERSFPTWMKILRHVGSGLDSSIKMNVWAQNNGISTGSDYLKCWLASLVQQPTEQLPYLFLFSPEQSTGKTIVHEAIRLLFTRGCGFANIALTDPREFNAEIEDLVLCIIEEQDVSRNAAAAYNRLKNWVTAKRLLIHGKGVTPYEIVNTTHWIQTGNNINYCPVYEGDKRITMIRVPDLDPAAKIPKTQMLELLRKESPDFLGELFSLELPSPGDRMAVEPIDTEDKKMAQEANMTALELFVKEHCYYVPGSQILAAEFAEKFWVTLPRSETPLWTKIKINRELPSPFQKGNSRRDNQVYIINMSWSSDTPLGHKLYLDEKNRIVGGNHEIQNTNHS